MRNIKLILWLLVCVFVCLVIFQNQGYFFEAHSLNINLKFAIYKTKEITNLLFLSTCLVTGFFLAYFLSLLSKFKSQKIIKALQGNISTHKLEISNLKIEMEKMRKQAFDATHKTSNQIDSKQEKQEPELVQKSDNN